MTFEQNLKRFHMRKMFHKMCLSKYAIKYSVQDVFVQSFQSRNGLSVVFTRRQVAITQTARSEENRKHVTELICNQRA